MKFTSLIVSVLLGAVLGSMFCTSSVQLMKLCQKRNELRQSVQCKKFIAQSFKNTCSGRGFENLEEWKKVCSILWALDSIDYTTEEDSVIRGVWMKDSKKSEVYWKK